jgi:murein peptide amidase A
MERERSSNASPSTTAQVAAALERIARRSDFLASQPVTTPELRLERFVFEGPQGGGDPIRIAFFAGIHGDEKGGPGAMVKFAETLVSNPAIAEGYYLYFYPVCNPDGFDAGTRCSRSGKDLNREFWSGSSEAEVVLLEREIHDQAFHGLVSFHSDDTSDGMYGFVRGAVLARSLLEPALARAEAVLPRNSRSLIDGFPAENGIISVCYDGILTSSPKLENTPFEIIFETPHQVPMEKQIDAFVAASITILDEYRKFISFAADL